MQVKEEIVKIVDNLPDDFLQELLQYLTKLDQASQSKAKLSLSLNAILIEDKEVLSKLAQ